MNAMLVKILRGSNLRRSRCHDEKGNFAGWSRILAHGVPAFCTALGRACLGHRPALPWIPYSIINRFEVLLGPESRVLEFGSGMSTIWYAGRSGSVYAVEDDPQWYTRIAGLIERRRLSNVTYVYAATEEEYCSFMADDSAGFDLVIVDGSFRSKCVASAAHLLRPGGALYLDNSDKDSTPSGGDMRSAEALLRTLAHERSASIVEVTDFAPTQFFVHQGLFMQSPHAAAKFVE